MKKKTLSIITAALLTVQALGIQPASAVSIDSVEISGGSANITLSGDEGDSFKVYAASYTDSRLTDVVSTSVTMEGTTQSVTIDGVEDGAKIFVWDDIIPLCAAFNTAYTAEFVTDGGAAVTAYNTKDYTADGTENASSAQARNSDTGEIDTTGDGQINFMIVLADGYELSEVTAEPAENYKNIKLIDSSSNIYRITKISGDITVTITTKAVSEEDEGDGIIHLNNTSINAAGVEGAALSGTTVTISQAGTYSIEGTLDNGQIIVAAAKSDEVVLNLDNVNVTSSTGNALDATNGKVTIANSGTSTFKTTADSKVAIFSQRDLTIKGEGTLNAISTLGNGIRCKADLEIGAGDINVTAYNHGIKGDESVEITQEATNITVTAETGDAIKTDAISSDTLEYEKGNITINGGTLSLTAAGDGIQADDTVTINDGTITINSGNEGIKANTVNTATTDETTGVMTYVEGCVVINGGTLSLTSQEDGIKGAGSVNITGGSITIDAVLDGIQSGVDYTDSDGETQYSQGDMTITDGMFKITAGGGASAKVTDESSHKGIKAYNDLTITGGTFDIDSYDDSIHSNLNVTITGGTFETATTDDGIHADYILTMGTEGGSDDDYYVNISASYEGIESSVIKYLSGTTYICSTDDGVNAAGYYDEDGNYTEKSSSSGSGQQQGGGRPSGGFGGGPNQGEDDSAPNGMLYIKGGNLYVVAGGDGIDSNGDIAMSGGVVVVNGPESGANGVFDKGDNNNTFTVTGGTLIGFGTSAMVDNPTSVVGQGYYSSLDTNSSARPGGGGGSSGISITKGELIKITTDSGYIIIKPEITVSNGLIYVTCPDMTSGKTYTKSTVTSYSGTEELLGRTVNGTWYGVYQK